jgi:hypothetical protein
MKEWSWGISQWFGSLINQENWRGGGMEGATFLLILRMMLCNGLNEHYIYLMNVFTNILHSEHCRHIEKAFLKTFRNFLVRAIENN